MSMFNQWPKVLKGKEWVEQKARPVVDCSIMPSMTVQADASEADINKIIARFEKAGMVSTLNRNVPFYGDVSELGGLQEAIMKVQAADELFMGMSASIRERFDNDPVKMVEFLSDEANRSEAESLGMVVPKAPPADVPREGEPPAGGEASGTQ